MTTIRWVVEGASGLCSHRAYLLFIAEPRTSTTRTQLHPSLPITTHQFDVLHGCTSKGPYDSSAVFFRYDPRLAEDVGVEREFLFFGDMESDWRRKGEEGHDSEGRAAAEKYNTAIWTEAAESWDVGRLAGVFASRTESHADCRLNVHTIRTDRHI